MIVDNLANDTQTTLMPYESGGYRYQILPPTQTVPAGFEQPNYNDAAWSVGQASFGYNDGCIFPFNLKTHWQTDTRLILRKNVYVPPGATNLGVKIAVDNDIEKIWFNGTQIAGFQSNDNCPLRDEYGYAIPQNLVQTGNNLIAYQVIDRGRQTYFDSRIVADYSVSCSTTINGLVSWWKAEGNANDSLGNNNGTLRNGATFAPGIIGQAFNLDGIDDYSHIPNNSSLNPTGSFSADAWIFPLDDNNEVILTKWGDSGSWSSQRSYSVQKLSNRSISFAISDDANQGNAGFHSFVTPNDVISINQWNHIAVVYNQPIGKRSIYVNGVEVATLSHAPITITNGIADLGIGRWLRSPTQQEQSFQGKIDEVKIYNRALSVTEIYNNYAAGNSQTCQLNSTSKPFDFDGDGKSDVSVFRPSNSVWYVSKSSDSQVLTAQWGIATDKIVPADYNGDGKTDYAVFRDGFWYILYNGGGFQGSQWGSAGDIPFPADFDADGKADLAVFRNGTWFVLKSSGGGTVTQNWGSAGDIPVAADYDNDGKADFAVYRNGIWYVLFSTGGNTAIQWGIAGDKTVPGDYNGDGKADYAVFRNGFWYILYNGGGFQGAQWGASGDLAAPADYDGDGKTDLAVFRAGTWYIQRTTAGVQVVNFGSAGDKPVPNAFVP